MDAMPNRIRELRNARGWKLEQLADKVGMGVTYLSDIERGNRELSYHWMKRLGRALKVQPADLLNHADNSRSLSGEQQEWLELLDQVDEPQRKLLLHMARTVVVAINSKAA